MNRRSFLQFQRQFQQSVFGAIMKGELKVKVSKGFAEIRRRVDGVEDELLTLYNSDEEELRHTAQFLTRIPQDVPQFLDVVQKLQARNVPIIRTERHAPDLVIV